MLFAALTVWNSDAANYDQLMDLKKQPFKF